mmetsp:Transcript_50598/g.120306  ORF Transcript_50598/g.120306 Transcript_50598/m.120306 type:complete len:169 (+) Transcript_50598:480-986(+)
MVHDANEGRIMRRYQVLTTADSKRLAINGTLEHHQVLPTRRYQATRTADVKRLAINVSPTRTTPGQTTGRLKSRWMKRHMDPTGMLLQKRRMEIKTIGPAVRMYHSMTQSSRMRDMDPIAIGLAGRIVNQLTNTCGDSSRIQKKYMRISQAAMTTVSKDGGSGTKSVS